MAEAARAYRLHFGTRLKEIWALREDPYEPEAEMPYVYLVLLFEHFKPFQATAQVADVADELMQQWARNQRPK